MQALRKATVGQHLAALEEVRTLRGQIAALKQQVGAQRSAIEDLVTENMELQTENLRLGQSLEIERTLREQLERAVAYFKAKAAEAA